jgi:hypothetical protein
MAERLPTKGEAAPLHGDATKKLMLVLNTAFAMIGLSMLSGLVHKMGAKLGHSGPANQAATPARAGLRQAPPGPGNPKPPGLDAPTPPTFTN